MDARNEQRQTAKRLGLEARLDDIKDIYQGYFNGDGDQDYKVLYADGTIQLYLHKGYAEPVAPDSAETYLKKAPN